MGKKKNFIQKAYDDYQEFSGIAGKRAGDIAWAFIIMMAAGLVSGHAFSTFSICAGLALLHLLLGMMQSLWQSVAFWFCMCREKRIRKQYANLSDEEYTYPEDYPDWVGFVAWVFYYAKMIVIAAAVVYFIHNLFI